MITYVRSRSKANAIIEVATRIPREVAINSWHWLKHASSPVPIWLKVCGKERLSEENHHTEPALQDIIQNNHGHY